MTTVADLSRQTGNSPRTIRRWCAALGIEPITARFYLLTDEQVADVKERMQDKPGRPRK